MKKLILSILFIFISTFSYAEDFYVRSNSTWNVIGKQNDDELNPACFAITSWKDGSEFRLIFDLADGELYMLFINNQWNISDQPGKYNFRLNMYINNDVIGDNAVYELLNKNTLRVRGLPIKFVDVFAQSNRMQFIMPGNINNATVNLKGSSQAIDFMSECIKKYKPSNQQPKSKNFGISL